MVSLRGVAALLVVSSLAVIAAPSDLLAYPGGVASGTYDYGCGRACHNDVSASTVEMWTPSLLVGLGEVVNVTVNVTGAEADGTPLGVMIVSALDYESISLEDCGWTILLDPSGVTAYNYHLEGSYYDSISLTWMLKAPVVNCTVTIYAHEVHGNGGTYYSDCEQGLTFFVAEEYGSGADIAPPAVSVIDPAAGETADGMLTVQAEILSQHGIQYAMLLIDGVLFDSRSAEPYTWGVDTTLFSNGLHSLNVTAVDERGVIGWYEVDVYFENSDDGTTMMDWAATTVAAMMAAIAACVVMIIAAIALDSRRARRGGE